MTSSAPDGSRAFGGHAALYARRRPGYPPTVFDALDAALKGPRDHAVDLGAGSGQATKELAKRFAHVTAIEPDTRMAAEFPAIANVDVLNAAAETAEIGDSAVDAVVAATSFHWMDQKEVVANAHRWLRAGGVFFPFRYSAFEVEGPAEAVFRKHEALWAPFKDRRLTANIEYGRPVVASGLFSQISYFADDLGSRLSAEEAAGLFGTTSFGSAYARANYSDPDRYIELLAQEFRECGDALIVKAPLKGVIAVKA